MRNYRITLMVLALLFPGSAVVAQSPREAAFQRLNQRSQLRIETGHNGRAEGRFSRLGTDSLGTVPLQAPRYVMLADQANSISIADVVELRVRRSSPGRGALVGALVLGFVGVVASAVDERDGIFVNTNQAALMAASGIGGAAMGALLGAVVGLAIPHWQLRYRRP